VKRQKTKNLAPASSTWREEAAWMPLKEDWEPQVVKVDAVERDESGKLLAYILFSNGEQTCVGMDKVHRHCPRSMLRFYEEHLRFGLTNMES
jgi:chromobox protein 1